MRFWFFGFHVHIKCGAFGYCENTFGSTKMYHFHQQSAVETDVQHTNPSWLHCEMARKWVHTIRKMLTGIVHYKSMSKTWQNKTGVILQFVNLGIVSHFTFMQQSIIYKPKVWKSNWPTRPLIQRGKKWAVLQVQDKTKAVPWKPHTSRSWYYYC